MAPHGVEGSRIRFSWHRGESEVIWLPLDATSSTPLFVKVLVGYAAVRLVRAWSRGKKRRAIPMVVVSSTQHLRNTAQGLVEDERQISRRLGVESDVAVSLGE
ncbi:hypothetical protein PCH_Pc20g02120 [Penicillium rubens Wisconsin 54-1255]|uniref:Uncharacterized protein n=1 Tax=Penicillium rubens (strain ATCC 28089 / DSM 1075 / NRRL 1951 / Wisconsin 54-1255) TaxID=500485 RepID=B6HEA1_PENRW|nr:hypothetical protein PCH_Pc20g02120 [Penicillium rubens Wisconsin 54-1255]